MISMYKCLKNLRWRALVLRGAVMLRSIEELPLKRCNRLARDMNTMSAMPTAYPPP